MRAVKNRTYANRLNRAHDSREEKLEARIWREKIAASNRMTAHIRRVIAAAGVKTEVLEPIPSRH